MVCKERGHSNLLYCSKLPEYIPRGNNVITIPRELCKFCLSTAGHYRDCTHTFPRDYKDWMCKLSKVNFILCKDCQKHQGPQDWLKVNFKPNIGRANLLNVWKEFNSNNALINSIQVQPEHQPAGIADIEDIMDEGDTAYVRAVLVNQLRIGRACTPFEVIRVRTNSGYYPIVLIYDTGAQVSLCNFETGPVLIESKQADRRVTISTIDSSRAKLRRIHTLDLGEGHNMDAILIPKLRLNLRTIDIPEPWQHLDDTFADQDYYNVQAQILVGADKSKLFPLAERDSKGEPIETDKCRLMRSRITNKLILFGACDEHQDSQERMDTEAQIHQVQAVEAADESLCSIMQNLAISDFEPVDPAIGTK